MNVEVIIEVNIPPEEKDFDSLRNAASKLTNMMFYIANWGTWRLIFRFPKAIANPNWFQPYDLPDTVTISTTSQYIILDVQINESAGEGQGATFTVQLPLLSFLQPHQRNYSGVHRQMTLDTPLN